MRRWRPSSYVPGVRDTGRRTGLGRDPAPGGQLWPKRRSRPLRAMSPGVAWDAWCASVDVSLACAPAASAEERF
ncbi:hypothetical protein STTU_5320 [Streptomyces sp. Tu6071]|nr:hypothetical protein STTU_5320 [Streptomyces sp. Tu6071]